MWVLGLIEIPWWVLLTISITIFILYTTKDFDYFKKQGVPYIEPWPIFGTSLSLFRKGVLQHDLDAQERFGGDTVVGDFGFGNANLISFSADFLSKMMIKEFSSFPNRFTIKTGSLIADNMLTTITDQHWKHVRSGMTPTFTTGRIKKMNTEINRCAKDLVENLSKAVETGGNIVAKDYTGAYTMDVIASSAFGIRVNSQKDPDNAFVKHAKKAFDLPLTKLSILLPILFPKLANLYIAMGGTIEIFEAAEINFFSQVTKQTMAMRKDEKENTRSDFIELMLKAQKGEDIKDKDDDPQEEEEEQGEATDVKGLTTNEIIANAMLFFTAGYDTTASSLQFFLYNMARYPKVQQKLVEEINKVIGDSMDIDYSMLKEMPYLDQCVNENLRMYPPAIRVDRRAGHDVTINNIRVKKGMTVNIPIYAIHHDPKKWPDPEHFDPERFSPEKKKNRHPFHFLPFGHGPRNCIGMRLALLEVKVAIIYMLRAFRISSSDKTVYPLTFQVKGLLVPNEELIVKIEPRRN